MTEKNERDALKEEIKKEVLEDWRKEQERKEAAEQN